MTFEENVNFLGGRRVLVTFKRRELAQARWKVCPPVVGTRNASRRTASVARCPMGEWMQWSTDAAVTQLASACGGIESQRH